MIKRIFAVLLLLVSSVAHAQFTPGQILTAAQLNSALAAKFPLTGGTLAGPLTAPSLSVTGTATLPSVAITGGTITGLSAPVPVASGGTGAATQSAALAGLLGSSAVPIANGGTNATTPTGATSQLQYLQGATGSASRSVTNKLQDRIDAKDFGVKCDGSTDDTANLQSAANVGGMIMLPPGTCMVSGTVTANNSTVFIGTGANSTTIETTSPTLTVLELNATLSGVQGIGFTSSVTRTAGAYVYLTGLAGDSYVKDFYMTGYFIGIYSTNGSTEWFSEGLLWNPAANGTGIQLTGTVLGGGNDLYLNHITMSGSSNTPSAAGINLVNTGAVNITDCDIIHHGNDLLINPGTGQQVAYVYANNTYFDTATNGVNIAPTGTGLVQGVRLMGTWTSAHTGQGVNLAATGGTIAGIELIGHQCFSNGGNCVSVGAGTDVHILGGVYAGNTGSGLSVAAGVSFFSVVGARIGNGYDKAGNAFGIFIAAGSSNDYLIVGNDLTGNTSANFSDGGTGTIKNIRGNTGMPVGATGTITVGTSPFTYTAGPLPETVYVNQGTVSLVSVNGVGVFQSSNVSVQVQPNSTVVVTYTAVPTMAKTINNN